MLSSALVHPENQVNVFLSHSGARPLACAAVAQAGDSLLVFSSLAMYVDRRGLRARDTELMYTAHPAHHGNRSSDQSQSSTHSSPIYKLSYNVCISNFGKRSPMYRITYSYNDSFNSFRLSLVWCPGRNKRIAPLSFLHGCRKRRLKD
jgi:hypothetical protein